MSAALRVDYGLGHDRLVQQAEGECRRGDADVRHEEAEVDAELPHAVGDALLPVEEVHAVPVGGAAAQAHQHHPRGHEVHAALARQPAAHGARVDLGGPADHVHELEDGEHPHALDPEERDGEPREGHAQVVAHPHRGVPLRGGAQGLAVHEAREDGVLQAVHGHEVEHDAPAAAEGDHDVLLRGREAGGVRLELLPHAAGVLLPRRADAAGTARPHSAAATEGLGEVHALQAAGDLRVQVVEGRPVQGHHRKHQGEDGRVGEVQRAAEDDVGPAAQDASHARAGAPATDELRREGLEEGDVGDLAHNLLEAGEAGGQARQREALDAVGAVVQGGHGDACVRHRHHRQHRPHARVEAPAEQPPRGGE
mmetsp:Transcript_103547/g.333904  ORF Transcript_103547/g.333904 Transcript_103547/m.333904 type:complete len:367 (-) Transcript_103547:316-1416(-)